MIRTGDRERWLAALLAPQADRADLVALYAFNLETARVRHTVSEPLLGQIRLQWWREAVAGLANSGATASHPAIEALAAPVAGGRLAAEALVALIDAHEAALDGEPPASLAAFLAHADATAGALNRLALGLLAGSGPSPAGWGRAIEAGTRLGHAQALAAVLSAVAFEAAHGRIALPADLMAAHGVAREDLLEGRPGSGLADLTRELVARARHELAAARAAEVEARRKALPVLAAARMVEARLDRLERAGFAPFAGNPEPAPLAAPLAVLRAAVSGRY